MSLTPPETVGKLQAALHAKAKGAPSYRFYALYDKLYRPDVLSHAYERCQSNGGAAGVDGQTFADIEAYGRERWLDELRKELHEKTYRPRAVRRVWIAKPDGGQRPLGIPTVKDRVVQMAAVLVLDPIFEADLPPEQYAFRRGRSALDAVQAVQALLKSGHTEVVDADLSEYFDSIPHAELLRSVARRVSDRYLLGLVARWLEMPVEETDTRGRTRRTTRNKDQGRGIPQGAPLSPLLANLYMRCFILAWKLHGHERRFAARIVNYADDFVICCRGSATEVMEQMRAILGKLKLTMNETKTRLCRVPDETFDFLGYTFGLRYSPRTGNAYIGSWPSQKAVHGLCADLTAMTRRMWTWLSENELIQRLNRAIRGWANYFCFGTVSATYQAVKDHVCWRLRQWLSRKRGVRVRASRCPDRYLHATLGLIDLAAFRKARRLPWATA